MAEALVVVLAVPSDAIHAVTEVLGAVSGRVVVDATNPIGRGAGGIHLITPLEGSAGEAVAVRLSGARVV